MTQEWHLDATCYRSGDARFFAWSRAIAKGVAEQYCARCPVIDLCLAEGRRYYSVGVWGGRLFTAVPRREINLLKEMA